MTANYMTGTRYYYLPDDGATFTCKDCGGQSRGGTMNNPKSMVVVITPNGHHATMHLECVEPHWLANATLIQPPLASS